MGVCLSYDVAVLLIVLTPYVAPEINVQIARNHFLTTGKEATPDFNLGMGRPVGEILIWFVSIQQQGNVLA